MFTDSHAHLGTDAFGKDREEVVERAAGEGVVRILCPADLSDADDLRETLNLAEKHAGIAAAAGVHPHAAHHFHHDLADTLRRLAEDNRICAVGEIGLDFHYDFSPRKVQIEAFRSQLRTAEELDLPVIIHSREASREVVAAVREEGFTRGGVLHCFTGEWEFARNMLDLGFFVSFSGILTFAKAHTIRETAARLPADRILVETDSPYLVPEPYRGRIKRNEPKMVKEVVQVLAQTRKADPEETAWTTTRNFGTLWKNFQIL